LAIFQKIACFLFSYSKKYQMRYNFKDWKSMLLVV